MSDESKTQIVPASKAMRYAIFHDVTQEQVLASLPANIKPDWFAAQCLAAIEEVLNTLKAEARPRVTTAMFVRAAQQTAAFGLVPGKQVGECAWIFRKGWQNKPDSLTVMPQWQGLLRKMSECPGVARIDVDLVHTNDTYNWDGETLVHDYDLFDDREFVHPENCDGGDGGLRGAYVRVTFIDGSTKTHAMSNAAIQKRRMCSQNPGHKTYRDGKVVAGVWVQWYAEMVRKTVLRDVWARRIIVPPVTYAAPIGRIVEAIDIALDNKPDRAALVSEQPKRLEPVRGQDVLSEILKASELKTVPASAVVVDVEQDSIEQFVESRSPMEGDALRHAQRKLRAMSAECAKSSRAQGDAGAYFDAAKLAAGVDSSTSITASQAQMMDDAMQAEIRGDEPLILGAIK